MGANPLEQIQTADRPYGRDHAMAELAAGQRGLVSRRDILDLGFSEREIDGMLERAQLHRFADGVYAVGHPGLSRMGRAQGALIQLGPLSGLSHESAARYWGMKGRAIDGDIHVSVAGRGHHVAPTGVVIHHPRALVSDDLVGERGLRIVTPERTVLDLLTSSSVVELTRMLEQMVTKQNRSPDALTAWGKAVTRRPGKAKLTEALDWVAGPAVLRSEFEARFRSFCQERGLPQALTNHRLGRWEIDAVYLEHGVAVELDSWRYHGGRWQFHRDRTKGLALSKAGFELIRITWWQLIHEQDEVHEAILYALARGDRRRLLPV